MKKLVLITLLAGLQQIQAQCAITISGSTTVCVGSTTTLTASGASSYTWMPSGVNTATLSVSSAGIYTVTGTTGTCTATNTVVVTVIPNPTLTVTSVTVCPGSLVSISLNVNPVGSTIAWSNNNTTIGLPVSGTGIPPAYTAPTNTILVNMTGIISYTPTFSGCVGPITNDTIVITPRPVMQHMFNQYLCPEQITAAILFSCLPPPKATDVVVYNWSYNGILPISGSSNPFPPIGPIPNTGSTVLTFPVTVYPTLNGCIGPDSIFTIIVYPKPIADFSSSNPTCLGQSTSFTDLSTSGGNIPINQWNWDFGNGNTSNSKNPTYILPTVGVHTVSLVATSNPTPLPTLGGCKDTVINYLYVNPNPVAAFSGDSVKGCSSLYTIFTNQSSINTGLIASWNWNFGNGQTSNLPFPPEQLYNNPSTTQPAYYAVSLTVTSDSGCISPTITKNHYIEVYPTAQAYVTLHKDSLAANTWDAYAIYSNNVTTATWSWGDGTTTVSLYPSHTYTTAGYYNICVSVQNDSGCTFTTCQNDSLYRLVNNSPTSKMVYVNVKTNPAGINQVSASTEQVLVYPNPSTGSFIIEPQNTSYNIHCTVHDVNGKVVLNQIINSKTTIDAGNLNEGVYNISLLSNGAVLNKRLIIVK